MSDIEDAVMRLLSFLTQIENHLSGGFESATHRWMRRANYHNDTACLWQPGTGQSLRLSNCKLSGGRHSISTVWSTSDGSTEERQTFFCAEPGDWETAAQTIATLCPTPVVSGGALATAPESVSAEALETAIA